VTHSQRRPDAEDADRTQTGRRQDADRTQTGRRQADRTQTGRRQEKDSRRAGPDEIKAFVLNAGVELRGWPAERICSAAVRFCRIVNMSVQRIVA
jgi:hypothetical protein